AGPRGTVIVGYSGGVVGMWALADGKRLGQALLHGPVVHLLLEDQQLYAATELGQHLTWDLGVFYRDYCSLMREIWSEVPVVWSNGRPVAAAAPTDHVCSQ